MPTSPGQINAETQNKLGHRISETKLFQDALSTNQPAAGRPKLRVVPDDDGDTFKNVQRGVMAFAEGCCAAIRNPNSHEDGLPELTENEALEQLSAFSLLARWGDGATMVRIPSPGIAPPVMFSSMQASPDSRSSRCPRRWSTSAVLTAVKFRPTSSLSCFAARRGSSKGFWRPGTPSWKRASSGPGGPSPTTMSGS
ncbi:TIGR02391 family protein [Streptomyces sp. NPDC002917]|uniref:TIGR02391 family protein n=1 Tax=Streptomyces sp. NPDC002917 TaxID=3364671 RepID=UPI00368AEAFF